MRQIYIGESQTIGNWGKREKKNGKRSKNREPIMRSKVFLIVLLPVLAMTIKQASNTIFFSSIEMKIML